MESNEVFRRVKSAWSAVLCLALGVVVGCGYGQPFSYKKVSGKVTYEDGTPIPSSAVVVSFVPQDAKPVDEIYYPRSGMAYPDADGNFDAVTSYKYGDGIVPGRHKVLVNVRGMSFKKTGKSRKGPKPLFDEKYTKVDTTPLEVDASDAPFHFKVEKP